MVAAGAELNAQNHDGWTPLHEAAARGLMDTTRLLVDHGADLAVKNKGPSLNAAWDLPLKCEVSSAKLAA